MACKCRYFLRGHYNSCCYCGYRYRIWLSISDCLWFRLDSYYFLSLQIFPIVFGFALSAPQYHFMFIRSTHRARRHFGPMLLLLTALLASCRSERVAFRFQLTPVKTVYSTTVQRHGLPVVNSTPVQGASINAIATVPAADAAAAAQLAIRTAWSRCPAPARHQLPSPASARPARRARMVQMLRVARQQAVHSPQHPSEDGEGLFILGIICALGGLACLLASPFVASLALALVGLGLIPLGILLVRLSLTTGHWSFG